MKSYTKEKTQSSKEHNTHSFVFLIKKKKLNETSIQDKSK